MNLDDLRTEPPGPDLVRPAAWCSWQDDVHPGAGSDGGEGRDAPRGGPVSNGRHAGNGDERLPPERLNTLRRWIADGGHNSPEVAEEVARRIIEAGEV